MYFNEIRVERFSTKKKKVAIIISYRYSSHRPSDLYRISNLIAKITKNSDIAVYVVDSGSPDEVSEKVKEICRHYASSYINVDTSSEIFSIAKTRNIGASYALEDYVFFHDIDLIATDRLYESLIEETSNNWSANKFNCYPCFYIDKEATESFDWLDDSNLFSLLDDYHLGLNSRIQNPALASSCILINRAYFLSIGGYDLEFYGHGFEDFELANRLCYNYPIFQRPYNYYTDYKKWFTGKYEGFRSLFSMHGNLQLSKGLFMVHLWHPNAQNSNYVKSNKKNAQLLIKKLKHFDKFKEHPFPLPDISFGKSCALGQPNNLFYKSIREILPYFGELHFVDENQVSDLHKFYMYLINENIDRVLLPNPYGNKNRLNIYNMLRNVDFPIIVSDRGALNNSWFFDQNGFNADSRSYSPEFWDNPIPSTHRKELNDYISSEKSSDSALEQQGKRQSPEIIKRKLGITNKKILFVPFQRPLDTVCQYFCGPIGSYSSFNKLVSDLSQLLSEEWIIIGKKHPLERNKPEVNGIIWAEDDMHFKDLIYISNSVLVLNSGVGLLALMWKKKVIVAGDAFYKHDGLTFSAHKPKKIKEILEMENLYPNEEKIYRFIYYLYNKFYSFGKSSTKIVDLGDGHQHSATTNIAFDSVRILNINNTICRDIFKVPINAGIFNNFKNYFDQKSVASSNKYLSRKKVKIIFIKIYERLKSPGFFHRNLKKLFFRPKSIITDVRNIILE